MSKDFFRSIKEKTQQSPNRATDQRVLAMARRELSPAPKPWLRWALVGVPLAAALVMWLQLGQQSLPPAMLAESPEMLRHMDEVELWAESADWSEEDWHTLETGET